MNGTCLGGILRCAARASAVLVLLGGVAQAEVGLPVDDHLRPIGGVYYVVSITEDPNPFGPTAWVRFSSPLDPHRAVLNEQGATNGDGPPSSLVHPADGRPVVAWARNSASGFDIVISTFDDGAWSTPEVVVGSPADELDPSLMVDPFTGAVHLFYWVDGPVPVVMHREAPADLSSWSVPVQVSNGVQAAFRPFGTLHEGIVRVVFEVHPFGPGQTPGQIVLSRKETQGFVQEIVAVSNHDDELWPRAYSRSGRFWIEWIDADDEVAWIRLDLQDVWEPARYEDYSSGADREFHVRPGIRLKAVELP